MGRMVLALALFMVFAGLFMLISRRRRSRQDVEPPARLDDYRRRRSRDKEPNDDPDDDLF